jgi:hypothetical protein
MRLEFVSFSVVRTVSWDTASMWPSATMRSASTRKVQRARPSGGGLQARAISRASASPSSLRG